MAQSLLADSPQRCTHCRRYHQIGMGKHIAYWGLVPLLSHKVAGVEEEEGEGEEEDD